ncbi:hypothetical protein SAMN05216326_1121 [Nitrosomonas marina]|uniref:DUF211 domain-containing protein n=1 Tax=Nitrosomonas marina TaxID=917 RepID=A0A1I0BUV9_9PROT|nr:DUF211 domain-containing protein [Nitrosomonas marina]SET10236.1 hypothetical protein SAMN05216326_1121 [Nitrosomonas marina]
MVRVKHLILDVLKPHQPNGLAFASALAEKCPDCHIKYTVVEVDEKTESVILSIAGDNIRFEIIEEAISTMGASIHSIDEVEVVGTDPAA